MHHVPLHGIAQGENPIPLWMCDGGTLASCPSWRRWIGSPDLVERWWWLVGGVACARRQMRCAWSVLAGRCRGPMGAGALELVRLVRWCLRRQLGGGVSLLGASDI
jgi:hypothetical protein